MQHLQLNHSCVFIVVSKVCAIKAPGFGENKRANLDDLAILTGGEVITEDRYLTLDKVQFEMLGTAKKVSDSLDDTIILHGGGDKKLIEERCAEVYMLTCRHCQDLLLFTSESIKRAALQAISNDQVSVPSLIIVVFTHDLWLDHYKCYYQLFEDVYATCRRTTLLLVDFSAGRPLVNSCERGCPRTLNWLSLFAAKLICGVDRRVLPITEPLL
nr:chaperonin cpn60-like 2, mitochondrial [Quercus suber]